MSILASYNIKGGVGKTATAVNLAYLCAREGARTLLWDLDPQGAASFYFRVEAEVKGGVKIIEKAGRAAKRIKATDFEGLDLIPADFSYRMMDIVLDNAKRSRERLEGVMKGLAKEYDVVFLDCPPGITLLSENIFHASDALIVPTIPTTLSLRTLNQLFEFQRENGPQGLEILPFYSMVDRRKHLHRLILETPTKALPGILGTHIPYAADVEKMGVRRQPLPVYAAASTPGRAYDALWREIKERLGLG
ncbi:ParA family protein [Endothiovibrio diazotrophicus]